MGEMRAVVRPGIEPSDLLITHAAELGTCRAPAAGGMPEKGEPGDPGPRLSTDLGCAGIIEDGAIAVRDGVIVDIGPTEEVLSREARWHAEGLPGSIIKKVVASDLHLDPFQDVIRWLHRKTR
jgi:imidazolonepropionase-like amidohydrolase